MIKSLTAAALSACAVPAIAAVPDLSGRWFLEDRDDPGLCLEIGDVVPIIEIDHGANQIHVFVDQNGRATHVEIGDGPFSVGFARTREACQTEADAKRQRSLNEATAIMVQPDVGLLK